MHYRGIQIRARILAVVLAIAVICIVVPEFSIAVVCALGVKMFLVLECLKLQVGLAATVVAVPFALAVDLFLVPECLKSRDGLPVVTVIFRLLPLDDWNDVMEVQALLK